MSLTKEQIDALPNPPFTPARDMMLCQRIASSSGLVEIPDHLQEVSQMCRVLVEGVGEVLDDGTTKHSPYHRGTKVMITPRDGYPVKMDGITYWVVEANEVIGEITNEDVTVTGRETP